MKPGNNTRGSVGPSSARSTANCPRTVDSSTTHPSHLGNNSGHIAHIAVWTPPTVYCSAPSSQLFCKPLIDEQESDNKIPLSPITDIHTRFELDGRLPRAVVALPFSNRLLPPVTPLALPAVTSTAPSRRVLVTQGQGQTKEEGRGNKGAKKEQATSQAVRDSQPQQQQQQQRSMGSATDTMTGEPAVQPTAAVRDPPTTSTNARGPSSGAKPVPPPPPAGPPPVPPKPAGLKPPVLPPTSLPASDDNDDVVGLVSDSIPSSEGNNTVGEDTKSASKKRQRPPETEAQQEAEKAASSPAKKKLTGVAGDIQKVTDSMQEVLANETGMSAKKHLTTFNRLAIAATNEDVRRVLLQYLESTTSQTILRRFIQLQGLGMLMTWTEENLDNKGSILFLEQMYNVLANLPVTLDALSETGFAKYLKKIGKKHKNSDVADGAKKVVKKWKAFLEEAVAAEEESSHDEDTAGNSKSGTEPSSKTTTATTTTTTTTKSSAAAAVPPVPPSKPDKSKLAPVPPVKASASGASSVASSKTSGDKPAVPPKKSTAAAINSTVGKKRASSAVMSLGSHASDVDDIFGAAARPVKKAKTAVRKAPPKKSSLAPDYVVARRERQRAMEEKREREAAEAAKARAAALAAAAAASGGSTAGTGASIEAGGKRSVIVDIPSPAITATQSLSARSGRAGAGETLVAPPSVADNPGVEDGYVQLGRRDLKPSSSLVAGRSILKGGDGNDDASSVTRKSQRRRIQWHQDEVLTQIVKYEKDEAGVHGQVGPSSQSAASMTPEEFRARQRKEREAEKLQTKIAREEEVKALKAMVPKIKFSPLTYVHHAAQTRANGGPNMWDSSSELPMLKDDDDEAIERGEEIYLPQTFTEPPQAPPPEDDDDEEMNPDEIATILEYSFDVPTMHRLSSMYRSYGTQGTAHGYRQPPGPGYGNGSGGNGGGGGGDVGGGHPVGPDAGRDRDWPRERSGRPSHHGGSNSGSGRTRPPCRFHRNPGGCRKGSSCPFPHE